MAKKRCVNETQASSEIKHFKQLPHRMKTSGKQTLKSDPRVPVQPFFLMFAVKRLYPEDQAAILEPPLWTGLSKWHGNWWNASGGWLFCVLVHWLCRLVIPSHKDAPQS